MEAMKLQERPEGFGEVDLKHLRYAVQLPLSALMVIWLTICVCEVSTRE
jgi:hypothetical protein